jgi:hypothetical protein
MLQLADNVKYPASTLTSQQRIPAIHFRRLDIHFGHPWYSILKKNPNAIYCQKAPYPYFRELCWAFSPNLGGGGLERKRKVGRKKRNELA